MNPCRTAALGLLLVGLAVAQQSAFVNGNLYAVGDLQNVAQPDAPYWWMNKGSPFKRSYTSDSGCGAACQSNTLQVSSPNTFANNPFLNGGNNAFAASNQVNSQYLSAASDDAAYAAPGYLPPDDNVRALSCTSGQVCVAKYLCRNGLVDRELTDGSKSTCNAQNEICCTVREAPTPAPKPVQPQSTPCLDKNYGCVSPDQCYNGVISAPNNYASRAPTQKCFAPEVCCRFPDQSPSPNQQNDYTTSPPQVTRPYFPPTQGEVLTSEGYVITVPETKFPVQQTTQRPYQPQTPQAPQTPRPYQPQTPQTPRPYEPQTPQTPRPYQPPAQPQTPRPYQPPAQTQTPRPYQPPVQTQTPRPYQPPAQPQTPRPYQPPVQQPTRGPFQGDQYIPPHVGDSSNTNPNYLPPNNVETGEDIKSEPIPKPSNGNPTILRPNRPSNDAPAPLPPSQCPAATNCTEIQFCTSNGVISKTPVILSPEQEIYRVPLSDCRSIDRGFIGKCCRDPDYVDPWPVGILGQYNASILGFDDGSYKPTSGNGARKGPNPGNFNNGRNPNPAPSNNNFNNAPRNPNQGPGNNNNNNFNNAPGSPNQPQRNGPIRGFPETQPSASNQIPTRGEHQLSLPIGVQQNQIPGRNTYNQPQQNPLYQPNRQRDGNNNNIEPIASGSGICAVRDTNAVPKGVGPFDAAFGEFPWQAMILKESTKSLLCGGAIIQADTVLTAANCVQGVKPYDILIKGGEWKLGSDEEPKPFQTVRVKSISFHPEYQSYGRDVALLHLEIGLKFDKHIAPICIDENDFEPTPGSDQCVCTGWGKDALKYHAPEALMHQIPIAPLNQDECSAALPGFNPNTATCGRPQVDACQTDVGSALACHNGNNQYLLKGVYSTENQCNSPAQIVTFAKVDVDWIKETMQSPLSSPQRQSPRPQPTNGRPSYGEQLLNQPQQPLHQQPEPSQLQQITYSIPSTQAPSYLPPRN